MHFQTPRLLLRPWAKGDESLLLRMTGDEATMRHIPNAPPQGDETAAREKLLSLRQHWTRHGFGLWVVTERETGEFAGRAGLQYIPGADPPEIEVGYLLLSDFWGKGYATELAQASLSFAFEHLKAEYVVALALQTNEASMHVMRKLGMTCEGTGTWYRTQMVRHSITEAAWKKPDWKLQRAD